MDTYSYLNGLKELSKKLRGDERIHVGFRPYEFHAGNALSIVAYPLLLFREFSKRKLPIQFELVVSINDWEIFDLTFSGKASEDPFNICLKGKTIQYSYFNNILLPDYWQSIVEVQFNSIKHEFPEIKIKYMRNSQLRDHVFMKLVIYQTIKFRKSHKILFNLLTNTKSLSEDVRYTGIVCPICKNVATTIDIIDNTILNYKCMACSAGGNVNYNSVNYCLYNYQLFIARWLIFNYDLVICGADHLFYNSHIIAIELYKLIMNAPAPSLNFLFAPLVVTEKGKKMSKSRNNIKNASVEKMIELANTYEEKIFFLG